MDIWTTLQVDHMTTPTEHLTTGVPPTIRRASLALSFDRNSRGRTCPPCLPDGEGLRTGESFALPRRSAVRELSPACRTEPGHRSGVWVASRATQQPRAQVYPCPSPGRDITASRWRFGMASRCSAYGAARPAENRWPGGGQVRRSCTPAMVDVQPCANAPRCG